MIQRVNIKDCPWMGGNGIGIERTLLDVLEKMVYIF